MVKKAQAEIGAAIFIVSLIIVGFLVFSGFDSVPAGNIVVKERMGVIDSTPWGPGIQWTGVLTSTVDFSTRIQLENYDVSAFSSDAQIVKTNVAVNFRIDPAKAPEIYKNIGENYQDIIIAPIVQETVKANTAKYKLDELVKNRETVIAKNIEIPIISIDDLITLKEKAGRERDKIDIKALKKIKELHNEEQ